MPKEKVPAFQFYPKDFLTDAKVVLMSNTEIGVYMRLLCFCWLEGDLPLEMESLAKMARMPLKQFTKFWENTVVRQCFTVVDGRMRQGRLDAERQKQTEFKRRQSDKGKASAAARLVQPRFNHGSTKPQPVVQPEGNSSSSSAISSLRSAEERGRGKPPLNLQLSGRFKVWQWMLDEWFERLKEQGEAFDIEAWLHDLDKRDKLLIPANTNWKWLDAQWWDEATKRGLVANAAVLGGDDAMWAEAARKGPSVRP